MKSKRESVLRELDALRKQPDHNFNKFNQLYHKHKKVLQPEDQSILDVYYVECKLFEKKRKEALDWALSNFKLLEYNQDLKCLLGQIYYDDKNYSKSLYYFNKIDFATNKQQFDPNWYKDGTLQLCQSVSLELLINSIFKYGYLQYQHNNNPQKAVKAWGSCFNLISSNVQSIAYENNQQPIESIINLSMYSVLAYQCIINISRIMLQSGQLSSCLTNVRASLQLSSHLEDFFHRQMLFKLGLLTFHYLSPVDWNNNLLLFNNNDWNNNNNMEYCYIPHSIDEEAILALMVHQRLCQLTLQRSMRHKHRRRAQELRLQKLREQQKSITHQQALLQQQQQQNEEEEQQKEEEEEEEEKKEDLKQTEADKHNELQQQIIESQNTENSDIITTNTTTTTTQQQQAVNLKYILADDETEQIEGENLLSLLFLTILLSIKREFYPLSKCILRSLNEKQIDCSRWYKYGLSLYGNNELTECIRACHHSLQNDTIIGKSGDYQGIDSNIRHHFILSACLLATRSALLLYDNKTALSYGRAAVRLSLSNNNNAANNDNNTGYLIIDQRSTAYLLFSIACSQSAYSKSLSSFEDRKSLHKLAMKSIIRACILSPCNQLIVFNLSLSRADLGDIDGALHDIRSLLQNLNPYHSESWHLLSLLLSSKRKWMESYRAIDQSLRYCQFYTFCTNNNNNNKMNKLRLYYKYKLKLTKIKILMKQNRISSPLQIFNELCKMLNFNERFYKMTKLPNSHKLCPLFQPISNKNDELIQFVQSQSNHNNDNNKPNHISYSLLLLRLEYILTLTSFYLKENVSANKYAFHCMEFALQFFGSCCNDKYILSQIYYKLGECSESLNQYNLALSHYKTAISYDSYHYMSLIGQSRIYLLNNKLFHAKSYLDAALKINAYQYEAWSVAAQIQQKQKLYDKASNSYLTSLELQRDQPIEPYSNVPRWLP